MNNITATVKHSDGFSAPRVVIQNPGQVPAPEMISSYVDVTIVFEGRYERVPDRDAMKEQLVDLPGSRDNYGVLIHSLPKYISNVKLRRLINDLKKDLRFIYTTDLEEDVYEGFGGGVHLNDF
ncbi:uncharacterized protein EI97DRAFT_457346 [Westerdykella ornata]|uniref:Uncharacterized protein n=1 Tax=Westerdykella ornata TaxID=318751 RepID=A0A6A6JN13_WESOR|nr:uncharacterized protein EI97DRAFT_457346 [Westerdykella ornata]KAF2277318.1 hypothetical protein EI97DRAFT_457346 [Westerdykella ornata]